MTESLVRVVAAVIRDGHKYLVAKRPPSKPQAGYWEFPGGKVEPGEAAEAALERELVEELDARSLSVGAFLAAGEHRYGEHIVRIEAYWVTCDTASVTCLEHAALAWASVDELRAMRVAPADLFILSRLT
jgi:8-oxo-dGTP diphosphatase